MPGPWFGCAFDARSRAGHRRTLQVPPARLSVGSHASRCSRCRGYRRVGLRRRIPASRQGTRSRPPSFGSDDAAGGMSLVVGDYRIQAGSGILLGRASFSAVGARLFQGRGTEAGPLKPHTSADENRFFRGLAARLPLRLGLWSVEATVFASSVKRSGRIDDSGAFSPYAAGLFRTPSELGRLNTNRERLGGAIVALRAASVRMECAGLWTGLATPIVVEAGEVATCRSWTAGSVGFGIAGSGFELSGEVAYARSAALTFEARATPGRQMTTVVRVQSVRPGFLAPYGTEASGRSALRQHEKLRAGVPGSSRPLGESGAGCFSLFKRQAPRE